MAEVDNVNITEGSDTVILPKNVTLVSFSNNTRAAEFLQECGILPKIKYCDNGHEMTLHISEDTAGIWKCRNRGCKQSIGYRKETWLEGLKSGLRKIVLFIYLWSHERTSVEFCKQELGITRGILVMFNNYLREVCAWRLLQTPSVIGGVNCTVEIDESLYYQRKNNTDRIVPQQWVLGGYCRETKECFMYAVEDCTAETLLRIIKSAILPGTTIIFDKWSTYRRIEKITEENNTHQNHTYNFIDPQTGAHKQFTELTWRSAKMRNKKAFGSHMLDTYLCEFLWRQRLKERSPFEAILEDIKAYWPPN